MNFSFDDRKAIYCIARAMVLADDEVVVNEMKALATGMSMIGSTPEELMDFENSNESFEPSDAVTHIAGFNSEKKEFVCAFLGTLIVVDGDVDANELRLWGLTTYFCDLPTMSISDAMEYMAEAQQRHNTQGSL